MSSIRFDFVFSFRRMAASFLLKENEKTCLNFPPVNYDESLNESQSDGPGF